MTTIPAFLPDDAPCDTKEHFRPASITVHWTGPYPGQTPAQVRQWWIDSKGEASAHFIIKDNEVLQCWPEDKVAWHAGCKSGNETSIGIEVIPADKAGKFSEDSIKTLAALVSDLRNKWGKLPLVRHYDWTGKRCPEYYVSTDRWVGLLKEIES